MNRKENILRYALYAAGVAALFVFIATKSEPLMEWATAHADDYGDLYRLAKVRDFKADIPPLHEEEPYDESVDANDFRIFLIGDSFSEASRGHEILSEQLAARLGDPVYHVRLNYTPEFVNPFLFFAAQGVVKEEKRIVIIERVERYIIGDFGQPFDTPPAIPKVEQHSALVGWWPSVEQRWFTGAERNYEHFLEGSIFTFPVVELWNTTLFRVLNRISTETPVYSSKPPMLFYFDETCPDSSSSFYYPHPPSLVAAIADNIAQLKDDLLEHYNADLVVMPIPTKYTIYHRFVNSDPYDGFVPQLCAALEARRVKTVKVYEKFMAADELLYWPTDSHWNGRGLNIALEETMNILRHTRNFEFRGPQ